MFEISLYGDIDGWWGISAESVQYMIGDHEGDMSIRLFSYGGDVMEGLAIYNMIARHPGKVTVYVDSVAASIASYVAMAADEVVIADNAMIMIHNPWADAWGESSDLKKTASLLDTMKETLITAYEKKTGLPRDDISAMMDEEKWMTAAEAVELGFADSIGGAVEVDEEGVSAKAAEKLFNRSVRAPAYARAKMRNAMKKNVKNEAEEVVTETEEEVETIVEDVESVATELADSVDAGETDEATAEEVLTILEGLGDLVEDELTVARELIAAKATRAQVHAKVLSIVKAKSKGSRVVRNKIQSGVDSSEKFVKGASAGLLFRASNGRQGERSGFSAMSLFDLARESVKRAGNNIENLSRHDIISAAFKPQNVSGITHSTSDFPNIIQTAFEVSVGKEFEAMEQAYTQWTGEGSLSNFLVHQIANLGAFSDLVKNEEGVEHKYGTFADKGESIQLSTWSRMVGFTRHAIINDTLDFFGKVPRRMADAVTRTIGRNVSKVLTDNANLSDGEPLFSVAHANILTGDGSDLTPDNIDKGITAMALQKDNDGQILGIRAKYLIVPAALRSKALRAVNDEYVLGPNGIAQSNPISGALEVVVDPNLDATSSIQWYLAADQNMYDTVEVDYLDGVKTPHLDTKDGWNIDGTEFLVRIDFGTAAIDYKGLFRGEGTAPD